MRIVLPVWQGRISPVLDTARHFLLVDCEGAGEVSRAERTIGADPLAARVESLARLGGDVVICGAVSRPLASLLAARGVRLCPWTAGYVDEVVSAYLSGSLDRPRFRMPGRCGRGMMGRRRRGRRRGGFGRGRT